MSKEVADGNPTYPVRTCIGCNIKKSKHDLVRIILLPNGKVAPDPSGKGSGRGAYLCPDMQCLVNAIKKSRFDRAFRCVVEKKELINLKVEYAECLNTRYKR